MADMGGLSWLAQNFGGLGGLGGFQQAPQPQAMPLSLGQQGQSQDANQAVNTAFRNVLGRNGDVAGLNFWAPQVMGGLTPDVMQRNLLLSPEFANRYQQKTGQAFSGSNMDPMTALQAMYHQLLRRDADPAGLNYFSGRYLDGASPSDIISEFQSSPEYASVVGMDDPSQDVTGSTPGSSSGSHGNSPGTTPGTVSDFDFSQAGAPEAPSETTSNPYGNLDGISFDHSTGPAQIADPSEFAQLDFVDTPGNPYGDLSGLSFGNSVGSNIDVASLDPGSIDWSGWSEGTFGPDAENPGIGSEDESTDNSESDDGSDSSGEGDGSDGGDGGDSGGDGGGDDRNGGYIAKSKKQRRVPPAGKLPKKPQMVSRKVHTGEVVIRPEAVKAVQKKMPGLFELINSMGAHPERAGRKS